MGSIEPHIVHPSLVLLSPPPIFMHSCFFFCCIFFFTSILVQQCFCFHAYDLTTPMDRAPLMGYIKHIDPNRAHASSSMSPTHEWNRARTSSIEPGELERAWAWSRLVIPVYVMGPCSNRSQSSPIDLFEPYPAIPNRRTCSPSLPAAV